MRSVLDWPDFINGRAWHLEGRIVLITGGAKRVGAHICRRLHKAGASIMLHFRASAGEARLLQAELNHLRANSVALIQADLLDVGKLPSLVEQTVQTFGKLDALVNNAGTTAKWKVKDLESLDLEEWDRVFAVNVRGLFQVTRAAVPLLKKGDNPSIVNTASIVGLRPGPQPLPYAASKAAVVNMTKTLAWNLGPEIRVNAVAPGWMEGDWMQRMLGDKYEDLMGKRARLTPLKRCVTADDVAETMLTLLQSNRFVTGEIIVIDGGFTSST
jgi:3-oxoacyl-[acyl-carrier protein] reductase